MAGFQWIQDLLKEVMPYPKHNSLLELTATSCVADHWVMEPGWVHGED